MTELHPQGSLTVDPDDARVFVAAFGVVIEGAMRDRQGMLAPAAREAARRVWSGLRGCSGLGSVAGSSEPGSEAVVVESRREISCQDAHVMTGFTDRHIRNLVQSGDLVGRKVGGRWLIDESSVLALCEDRQAGDAE